MSDSYATILETLIETISTIPGENHISIQAPCKYHTLWEKLGSSQLQVVGMHELRVSIFDR